MVLISIVTWNSRSVLPHCLASLETQTYRNTSIVIIDNASTDGTLEFLAAHYPHIPVIKNTTNRGFAAAQNQGIQYLATSSYVLVLNPDVILTPNYLISLVAIMEQNQKTAGITGQLLRFKFEGDTVVKTNIIDSEGLEMLPTRHVRERNAGSLTTNSSPHAVWGISGACALYRMSALEDVKQNEEYFDQDFFCYKEDVDISWRMQRKGWSFLYMPCAQAYHARGIGKDKSHGKRPLHINQW